jgi:hypothetical protein
VNNGVNDFEVGSGSDFRNNAAIFGMDIDLSVNDITEQPLAIFDNSGGSFVTTTFNSQNTHL